ncbi:YciI family protein [Sulfitobacter sp. S190]|uniref:YciI family protein n=1 Tax=Sulfitobacter sp. S190 TaxID=2867022 RepID=UPI0021A912A3|nr:YciI family protein [Sulfitobacter sp. S190]UWR22413.1 YciI family protein [Sulfitobacter sp. S190]
MPQFMLAYHGGKTPDTPEEGAQAMAAWEAWFSELGSHVVHPGHPVGMSKTVTNVGVTDDGGLNPLSGFTIVQADDIDAACQMASACPMVIDGTGSAEVAPIIEM